MHSALQPVRPREAPAGDVSVREVDRVLEFRKQSRALRLAAAALVAAAAFVSSAQAATLVGYFDGNDPFGGQEKGLYGTFNGVEISSPSLAKCDVPEGQLSCDWENGAVEGEDYTSAFDLTFNDSKSGNWSFTPDPSLTHAPSYLVSKRQRPGRSMRSMAPSPAPGRPPGS